MKGLSVYHNCTVRIHCCFGECVEGPCEWEAAEYGREFCGRSEESLKVGEALVFASQISEIEVLRREAVIPLRDWPEAAEEAAQWFHERWGLPLQAYRSSIRECLGNEKGIPQWYAVVRGSRIIAGCGVIANDFHERKDLTPNVCAVYVDEEFRGEGIAGFLLEEVCRDMAGLGYRTLYLLTDHEGFYERYGWQFFTPARGDEGTLSRVYVHTAPE